MEKDLPETNANQNETRASTSYSPRQRGNHRDQRNFHTGRRLDFNTHRNEVPAGRERGARGYDRKWTSKNYPINNHNSNNNGPFRRKKENNVQMSVNAKVFVPRGAASVPDSANALDELHLSQESQQRASDRSDRPSWNRRNESKRTMVFENKSSSGYNSRGNWFNRRKTTNSANFNTFRTNSYANESSSFKKNAGDKEKISQRDNLIEQLTHNSCECTVCCDRVRPQDPVWSCTNCYNIFHLKCIRKWAESAAAVVKEYGWRCPVCQHVSEVIPNQYFCFCGKLSDPPWNHYDTPHSCGEPCNKTLVGTGCTHKCRIQCHPGPCPQCQMQVERSCACGKTIKVVRCGISDTMLCEKNCEKLLNCGIHRCQAKCHLDACNECTEKINQNCHCGKQVKEVTCTLETSKKNSCGTVCGKLLNCGRHFCEKICHSGSCSDCQLMPEIVKHCHCGKKTLAELGVELRNLCTDPISSCGEICAKPLSCGPDDKAHICQAICHTPPCPSCPLKTQVKCRCGSQTKEVACAEEPSARDFICERKCKKKRRCGRHKCLQKCCIDIEHRCNLQCNRKLSCGLHNCEDLCHLGNCSPCWRTSFDEQFCECGASVRYPPIPCGTKPPECHEPCARIHPCTHPVTHNCHSEQNCPPCTYLTEKWCSGEHELRSNVPCYLTVVSCGHPCNKPLPCGIHNCPLICHSGICLKPGVKCILPCTKLRTVCNHPCVQPCHGDRSCPQSFCKAKVSVTCECGHLSQIISCAENQRIIKQVAASIMASKLSGLQQGESVDIRELVKRNGKNRRLECNEECALIERNRRLALALQIRNPELTNKLGPPSYSDFLKDFTKSNLRFITNAYNKLTEVVQTAKQSKQKSRSYAFPPMNCEQRRVIHELAEYFGCNTQSYDEEPKKNVVVTALRDKSWLPSVSLMTVVERESVHQRAPPPIPHRVQTNSKTDLTEHVSSLTSASSESKPPINYFDYNP